jgi:hypothetical protein
MKCLLHNKEAKKIVNHAGQKAESIVKLHAVIVSKFPILNSSMDYSAYLKLKKQSCSMTIARNRCIDSSLRTDMLAKAANRTYVPPFSTIVSNKESHVSFHTNTTIPVKPSETCGVTCSNIMDRYTTPFISISGCPITYTSTIYKSSNCKACYQATQFDNFKPINNFSNCANCG